jgi:hypothetical protein
MGFVEWVLFLLGLIGNFLAAILPNDALRIAVYVLIFLVFLLLLFWGAYERWKNQRGGTTPASNSIRDFLSASLTRTNLKSKMIWLFTILPFVIVSALVGFIGGCSYKGGCFAPVPIESISSSIYRWGGDYDTNPTTAGRSEITKIDVAEQGSSYLVSYYLPSNEKEVFAGITFELSRQSKDLTSFKTMELGLDLGGGTGCVLFIRDDYAGKAELILGGASSPSKDISVRTTGQVQSISIPIHTNFQELDLKYVKDIQIYVDSRHPRDSDQTFVVRSIRFVR